jgi:uncharacterized protein (TIGR03437 family)
LAAGTYTGSVQIASTGASNTPDFIAVTLIVAAAPPTLTVVPQALTFEYTAGGSLPAAQTVSVSNAGGGTFSWAATASDFWLEISEASGSAPGALSVSVNPANLAAGTYTASLQIAGVGVTGNPISVAVTLAVQGQQPAGSIASVTNAGSFQPGIAGATWISIFGTGLSGTAYSWQADDFVNGQLPGSLHGVSVKINGIPAFVEYISPGQVNVLAPDDTTVGQVSVQVTTAGQVSNSIVVQKAAFAPAFFTIGNGTYAAAVHTDYTLIGPAGLLPGVVTQPAQPGEVIVIYGTGFGPSNPALPTGQLVTTPEPLADSVQVTIGGIKVHVDYAGIVEAGLYQLNVDVPAGLPNGDAALVAMVGGIQTQSGISIAIQQ